MSITTTQVLEALKNVDDPDLKKDLVFCLMMYRKKLLICLKVIEKNKRDKYCFC